MSFHDRVTLDDVSQAKDSRDPALASLLTNLVHQLPDESTPQPEGVYTFYNFADELKSRSFRKNGLEEQAQIRSEKLASLVTAEVVPDRFRCHELILELWNADDLYSRNTLLEVLSEVPLVYGPWKAFKQIFKEAEANQDTEVYGLLASRLDMALDGSESHEISPRTIRYLCRRAWRYLRKIGETMPACYVDVATDFLVGYGEWGNYYRSWIFNHIFYHDYLPRNSVGIARNYTRTSFGQRPSDMLKYRAFKDLWTRSARPLFSLLERAKNTDVLRFATQALKQEFRAELRDVEAPWVARLVAVDDENVHDFVVWILENVPKFEQANFRQLNLHEPVLNLLESESNKARKFAASYARTHARDMPLERLYRLASSDYDEPLGIVKDFLRERDPRSEIGLKAWAKFLNYWATNQFAAESILKHFGANELTPEWFAQILLSDEPEFAVESLEKVHSLQNLGPDYFLDVAYRLEGYSWETGEFIRDKLPELDLKTASQNLLQKYLLHPGNASNAVDLVQQGAISPRQFGVDFLKRIAFHPTYESEPIITEIREEKNWHSSNRLNYDESTADAILNWLVDERQFLSNEIGFEWLMQLVDRSEMRYHDFAVRMLIQSFRPADFANMTDDIAAATEQGGSDPTMAGCQQLWSWLVDSKSEDAPRAKFALRYFRKHHSEIAKAESKLSLASDQEIPDSFLTYERVKPLFNEKRTKLRKFALQLAKYEFVRWTPPIESIVELCESPHADVRAFVTLALTCEDHPDHQHYRLDPNLLTIDSVYSFCESRDRQTRTLGMHLIDREKQLQDPEELFRLTESPDRKVRSFVIRTFWSIFRDRGITRHWEPSLPAQVITGKKKSLSEKQLREKHGAGAPQKPDKRPAVDEQLRGLLRRILFELPPARPPRNNNAEEILVKIRKLPARKAKLHLIETFQDLAIEDAQFADLVYPLLDEFMDSQGKSEQAACLVAVTRIKAAHPHIDNANDDDGDIEIFEAEIVPE